MEINKFNNYKNVTINILIAINLWNLIFIEVYNLIIYLPPEPFIFYADIYRIYTNIYDKNGR